MYLAFLLFPQNLIYEMIILKPYDYPFHFYKLIFDWGSYLNSVHDIIKDFTYQKKKNY